jgi:hypothetical protein
MFHSDQIIGYTTKTMNGSLGEAFTSATLHEIFPDKEFIKTRRPEWLNGLELDTYNAKCRRWRKKKRIFDEV